MSDRWIYAIDPGRVSGIAEYNIDKPHLPPVTFEIVGRHQVYADFGLHVRPREVVCEDFVISQRTIKSTPQKDPLYIIGWLEGTCHHFAIPFTLQTPSSAKSFASDDKLKFLGWYEKTPDGHANDACRHLLTYLIGHHSEVARNLLKGFALT